jgi:hypothetical protein
VGPIITTRTKETIMLKASRSDRFELYLETVVEGDCYTRSTVCHQLVGIYDTHAALQHAADAADGVLGYCAFEVRYPAAFARSHNTLLARQAKRSAALLASQYAAEYDVAEVPF